MKLKFSVTQWIAGDVQRSTIATFVSVDDALRFAEIAALTAQCKSAVGRIEVFTNNRAFKVIKIK